MGVYLLPFFKRYRCQVGLDVTQKFSKNTFWNCHNLVFKNMYHTSELLIFLDTVIFTPYYTIMLLLHWTWQSTQEYQYYVLYFYELETCWLFKFLTMKRFITEYFLILCGSFWFIVKNVLYWSVIESEVSVH